MLCSRLTEEANAHMYDRSFFLCISVVFRPDAKQLQACEQLGRELGKLALNVKPRAPVGPNSFSRNTPSFSYNFTHTSNTIRQLNNDNEHAFERTHSSVRRSDSDYGFGAKPASSTLLFSYFNISMPYDAVRPKRSQNEVDERINWAR